MRSLFELEHVEQVGETLPWGPRQSLGDLIINEPPWGSIDRSGDGLVAALVSLGADVDLDAKVPDYFSGTTI